MKTKSPKILWFGLLLAVPVIASVSITSITYTGTQTITDTGDITAGPSVLVQSGANITYVSGTKITLGNGFTAASGSTFHAMVDSVPATPSGFQTTAIGTTSVTLGWGASGSATQYEIYRGGSLLTTISAPTLTYTDSSVAAGAIYTYSVRAVNGHGMVSTSSAITVTVSPLEVLTPAP